MTLTDLRVVGSDLADSDTLYSTPLVDQMMHAIVVHRMLSTDQLHRLLSPSAATAATRKRIKRLVDAELIESIRVRSDNRSVKVWYATAAGVRRALADPDLHRRYVPTKPAPHRSLVAHTLAVNEVGISFVDLARRFDGHECDAHAWEHEIAHSLSSDRRTQRLIADAVLSYTVANGQGATLFRRFIELDRGTEPVQTLFDKLRRYAQYRAYRPSGPAMKNSSDPYWQTRYPTFPPICVVIGANPNKSSAQLTRRMHTLCALAANDSMIRGEQLAVLVARFEELVEFGPAAPVWWVPGRTEPTTFTGADL